VAAVTLCYLAFTVVVATPARASLRQSCVSVGTARPKIVETLVSHPGDWKKQGVTLTARWQPMPRVCNERFLRRVRISFQMQNPHNHRQWVTIGGRISPGGYVAPMLEGRDAEALQKEWERERKEEGRSCWEKNAAGVSKYTCPDDFEIGNQGGKATAEPPSTQNPTIRLPRRERYRCTPGSGVTHVRAHILSRVINLKTKKLTGRATQWVPIKVRRISLPASLLGHRGQLPGPC